MGGSALPSGVMMLTPLAAAIARERADGSLEVESFALPQHKETLVDRLPFVRILPKLARQMSLVVRGWKPRAGSRPSLPLLVGVVVLSLLSTLLNGIAADLPVLAHATISSLLQVGLFVGMIVGIRVIPRFARLWRFHGGEHQAIAAYEAGLDLTAANARSQTLYHPRCGTNLSVFALLLMVPGMVFGATLGGALGWLVTVLVPIFALCFAFEMVMWAMKRYPKILLPGLAFQRLTVAMPDPAESAAGLAALIAALAEHARIEAARQAA